jgi:5'-deoxynucleotidase YfbR-like HD superfamily hydrolase
MISTIGGKQISYLNPQPEQISITDIARGLSNVCRFTGQISQFYSVAEHSCHIYDIVRKKENYVYDMGYIALLHDASEAYMSDLPSPLKNICPHYMSIESKIMAVILEKYGLYSEAHRNGFIKRIDMQMLRTEVEFFSHNTSLFSEEFLLQEVFDDIKIQCWDPERAYSEYLSRFENVELLNVRTTRKVKIQ